MFAPQSVSSPAFSSSLVPRYRVTSSRDPNLEHLNVPYCPNAGWLKGVCKEHGTERWQSHPCKRRGCEVCGPRRRELIAWRVALGIEQLGGERGAGWFVGGFPRGLTKAQENRLSNQFVQWVRRYMAREFGTKLEWVKTWELYRSGFHHLNLIMSPWRYLPQMVLSAKWLGLIGVPVVWIKRVANGIGEEVAKSRQNLGKYISKFDQLVPDGRGVSYSKGWPKLPTEPRVPRRGEIEWRWVGGLSAEGLLHWYETEMGQWKLIALSEWASPEPEVCDCFEFGVNILRIARRMMKELREATARKTEDVFNST
jgi:hypothetical protein